MTIEIDGRQMKKCPGWEGNGFSCGRGSPRLIREDAEVCENCARGMRKRGQKTREEEGLRQQRRQQRIDEAKRGAEIVRKRVDFDEPMPLDPERAAHATLAAVLVAIEDLTGKDTDPRLYEHGQMANERLNFEDKWDVLRALVGREPLWRRYE